MKNNNAFSLMEILVVVAIIGILASVVTINLKSAQIKGRDDTRKANMEAMATALEIYYSQNKIYPTATSWDNLKSFQDTNGNSFYPTYISTWPSDPKVTDGDFPDAYKYYYKADNTGGKFVVDAKLEGKQAKCEDSGYSVSSNLFYTTAIVCADSNGKNHYRVAGR